MIRFKALIFVLIGLIIAVLTCVVIINARVRTFTTPTQGERIQNYKNPGKALLVIDIQQDFTGAKAVPPLPYKGADKFISHVNKVIENAYGQGIIPIYIRQEFENPIDKLIWRGRAVKGTEGSKLDANLLIKGNYAIAKEKSDAFSNKNLNDILVKNSVSELYIAGVDARACVLKTSIGAVNRGYKVNVIEDAIITQNMSDMPQIIKTYKQDGINVILSDKINDK